MTTLANVDAEMAVIGSVLISPDAVATVADWLPVESFSDRRCVATYKAILRLWNRQEPADFITVPAEMQTMAGRTIDLSLTGDFLRQCMASVESWFYVEHYAKQVKRFAWLREIAQGGAEIVKAAHGDADALDLESLFVEIRQRVEPFADATQRPAPLAESIAELRDETLRRWSGDLIEQIVPTNVTALDRMLMGGLRQDDFTILAGRPGMGKTAFALHMARRKRSLFCSLEMSAKAIMHRLVATEAGVPYAVGVTPIGDVEKQNAWLAASERVENWPLMVRDDLRTTSKIEAEVDRLQRGDGIDAVFIDHLSWIGDAFKSGTTQYDKVSQLSRRCAEIMKRTGVPVVVLSQLNREVEHRPGCTPYLSDLRDSGRVEEDATNIILLYCRTYYASRNMGGLKPDWNADTITGQPTWDRLTLSVVKNRNSLMGHIDCGWEAKSMKVHDIDGELAA